MWSIGACIRNFTTSSLVNHQYSVNYSVHRLAGIEAFWTSGGYDDDHRLQQHEIRVTPNCYKRLWNLATVRLWMKNLHPAARSVTSYVRHRPSSWFCSWSSVGSSWVCVWACAPHLSEGPIQVLAVALKNTEEITLTGFSDLPVARVYKLWAVMLSMRPTA